MILFVHIIFLFSNTNLIPRSPPKTVAAPSPHQLTFHRSTDSIFISLPFFVSYSRLPLLFMTVAYFQIVRVLWRSDTIPGHRESRTQPCGRKQQTHRLYPVSKPGHSIPFTCPILPLLGMETLFWKPAKFPTSRRGAIPSSNQFAGRFWEARNYF